MFKKTLKRLGAIVLALAMAMSVMMVSAFAATSTNNAVAFTKTLDMSGAVGANIPVVTFEYEITAGAAVTATADLPEGIYAGPVEKTISDSTLKASVDSVTFGNDTDTVKTVNVNLPIGLFEKAGIYRYKITEKATGNADITNDTNADRYLDVYVTNTANGGLEISYYVLLNSAVTPTKVDGNLTYGNTQVSKSAGYTNKYTTYSMSVRKEITGSMALVTDTFNFTITFNNLPSYATLTYTIGNETATTDPAGDDHTIVINSTLGDTTLQSLTDGNTITVTGIPSGATYTVAETEAKGYTASYAIDGGTTVTEATTTATSINKAAGKNQVVFTNTKNADTPTGVIMTIAPYVLMVALAGGIAFFFLRRRHAE